MRTSLKLLTGLCVLLLAACDKSPTGSTPSFLNCSRVAGYTLGSTVNGTLGSGDCRLAEDNTFVEYYRLDVSGNREVTITMRSDDVDSFLFMLDERGNLVAFDDDGDPQTEFGARLDLVLSGGRYYIGANTVFPGETGRYTLSSF